MDLDQIFLDWSSSIDLLKTRIIRFPSLVLLCGGPTSENGAKRKSCRDIFLKYLDKNKIGFFPNVIRAEEVFRYFEHASYTDLIRFEQDLAELSALTVIFSESPGSIAEFGSFAVMTNIQDKLLVVMNQEDTHQESFIWRGPALHLTELAKNNGMVNPISIYKWSNRSRVLGRQKSDFSDAQDLVELIESLLKLYPNSESVDANKLGHGMIIIIEILRIVQPATLDEIHQLLLKLGISWELQEFKQRISLLTSLDLVTRLPYSNNVYYFSSSEIPWVTWGYETTAKFRDYMRWRTLFIENYKMHQPRKTRALSSHLKATEQIGDSSK
ncbi:MAG: hypothetical protein FVQ79_04665 [Planctomycetes bacterium]|nr:hypothetical protein [Planctomycetota bacterium]